MQTEDVVAEDVGKLDCGNGHLGRDDVNKLRQAIHEDSDGIMSAGSLGEGGHEIHRHRVPTSFKDRKGLEETSGGESCGFVNLTAVACADV